MMMLLLTMMLAGVPLVRHDFWTFDFDIAAVAAVDDGGGPGGSGLLLVGLADFADVARFDSNLAALGSGSIFGG